MAFAMTTCIESGFAAIAAYIAARLRTLMAERARELG